jgi:hypothetical protein
MLPSAEPLPGFGMEDMQKLSQYFGELAIQEAMATMPRLREHVAVPLTPPEPRALVIDHACKYLWVLYFSSLCESFFSLFWIFQFSETIEKKQKGLLKLSK